MLPVGDDAAGVRVPPRRCLVASVDSLVEGTHFLPGVRAGRIGRAAVAAGLSDLASKGARPDAVLLAIVVPPGTPERWAREVVEGASAFAHRFGAHVVGGDTKPGPTPTIVATVLGWGDPRHLAPRTGARAGDLLLTTGTVGRGGADASGLRGTEPERRRAVERLLAIEPRVAEGRALAGRAHAMLDTSDGLADASRLLADASAVRVEVDESAVPWDPRVRRLPPEARRRIAFYGGDYELLAAIAPRHLNAARAAVRRAGGTLAVVGRVRAGRGAWLEGPDGARPMPEGGWKPFRRARPVPGP